MFSYKQRLDPILKLLYTLLYVLAERETIEPGKE